MPKTKPEPEPEQTCRCGQPAGYNLKKPWKARRVCVMCHPVRSGKTRPKPLTGDAFIEAAKRACLEMQSLPPSLGALHALTPPQVIPEAPARAQAVCWHCNKAMH